MSLQILISHLKQNKNKIKSKSNISSRSNKNFLNNKFKGSQYIIDFLLKFFKSYNKNIDFFLCLYVKIKLFENLIFNVKILVIYIKISVYGCV